MIWRKPKAALHVMGMWPDEGRQMLSTSLGPLPFTASPSEAFYLLSACGFEVSREEPGADLYARLSVEPGERAYVLAWFWPGSRFETEKMVPRAQDGVSGQVLWCAKTIGPNGGPAEADALLIARSKR